MPLAELQRAHRNPKAHDDEGIAASMARFGYVEAITMDERTGLLVAGHGRLDFLEGARDAGEAPPEGIVADGGFVIVIDFDDDELHAPLLTVRASVVVPVAPDVNVMAFVPLPAVIVPFVIDQL